jgi:biotin synthase
VDPRGIRAWLREESDERLVELWQRADWTRSANVGDAVHLRGLVEVSNYCSRQCAYCGIRAGNRDLARYRMSADEILACARTARAFGYGTVVLQSGEDARIEAPWMAEIVRSIKMETGLAITLSLGERPLGDLAMWRNAGADRYLMRFETSNKALFASVHPPAPGRPIDRVELLADLRRLGYEVGSGFLVGLPGQTYEDLARDIELLAELDLDMIGLGPYIPDPSTPLGRDWPPANPVPDQVPNTERMTHIVLALARLACPKANIPSTTALAVMDGSSGHGGGLARGANVIMPNVTPSAYRALYLIYPNKASAIEAADVTDGRIRALIASLRRTVGAGPGSSARYAERHGAAGGGGGAGAGLSSRFAPWLQARPAACAGAQSPRPNGGDERALEVTP